VTSYNLLALTERPLVKRVSHSVATGLVGQVALVASGVILARSLGVDDRGRLAVLVLTAAVVSQVGTLGVPTALTYATAHGDLVGRAVLWRIKWIIGLQLAIGAAIEVGILFAITRGWHGPWVAPTLAAIALTLLGMLQQYGLAALQGARRFRAFNVCRTLPVAGFSALAVAAVIFTHIDLRLAIVLLAFSTGVATAATMGTVLAGPAVSNREAEAPAPRSLLRFGFRALLTSSSPLETFRVDQAIVGLFLSARALGLYVVAAAFTNVPRFVAQSVGMVAYPEVAVAQTNRDARQRVSVFLMLGTALVLLVAVPLELGAGWLIPLFFGPDFGGATSACRLLIAAGALIGVRRVLTDCLNGLGRPQLGSYAEFVSWIALLLTLPIGAVVAGLPGVSAALLVSAGASLIFLAAAGLGSGRRRVQWRDPTSIALSLARSVSVLALLAGAGVAIPFVGSRSLVVGLALLVLVAVAISWGDFAFLLVLAGVFTVPLTTVRAPGNLGDVSDALFLFAFVAVVLRGVFRRDELRAFLPARELTSSLFLFLAAGLISTLHALAMSSALIVVAKVTFALWVLPSVFARASGTEQRLRTVAAAFLLTASVVATAAMSDLMLGTHFQQAVTGTVPEWGRYSGLTGHPNDLGTLMGVGIALSAGLVLTGTHRRAALLAMATCAGGLFASGSLTGAAAAAAGIGIAAVLSTSRRARRASLVTGVAVVSVALAIPYAVVGSHGVLANRLSSSPLSASSVQEREVTNAWAIDEIRRDPVVGHGLDQVGTGPTHSEELPIIHNLWLQTWYAAGLIGVIALALYYVGVWRLRRAIDPIVWAIFAPAAVAWLVAMLAQPDLYSRFGMFGVLGLIAAASVARSAPIEKLSPDALRTADEHGTRVQLRPVGA
jgi:O-antigen/teichoic acid export membrane protein/O-antigen ligase